MYEINEVCRIVKGKPLHKNDKSIDQFSTNSKDISLNTLFIPLIGEKHNGNDFILDAIKNGVTASFVSKNYEEKDRLIKICKKKNITLIEVNDPLKAMTKLAMHNRKKNQNTIVIGITGSNGKTSTKELIYDVLKNDYSVLKSEGNLNNHIGLPTTLLKLNGHNICILEMGMNHLGEIEHLSHIAQPNIAIITNIGSAHIGNLGSKEKILEAKLEIVKGLKKGGILLLNNEDTLLKDINLNNKINIYKYGYDDVHEMIEKKKYTSFKINQSKIKLKTVGEYVSYTNQKI